MRLFLEFTSTLLVFVLLLGVLAFSVWVIVDVIRTPQAAFSAANSSKALWLTLLLVFAVLAFFVTAALGLGYVVGVRPRVRAMMQPVN